MRLRITKIHSMARYDAALQACGKARTFWSRIGASDGKAYILLKNIRYVLIDLTLLTKA